jgi:transcriptional regulator with XRE-family HTH domain
LFVICKPCFDRGLRREATVEFEGVKYCTTCERAWIAPRRQAEQAMLDLPQRLRRAVKSRGYKFKEIAKFVDVSEPVFLRYVSLDAPARPSLSTLVNICLALKTHPNEVLGFVDPEAVRLRAEVEKYRALVSQMAKTLIDGGIFKGDAPSTKYNYGTWREHDAQRAEAHDRDKAEDTYST